MEDYAGKTNRELLVELYVTMKNHCDMVDDLQSIVENQQGEIDEIRGDVDKAKGAVWVLGGLGTVLTAKISGLFHLVGL